MKRAKILWADDEIDLLKPYILFLQEKGFEVVAVNNGRDAIEKSSEQHFDLIFLDEHMPGLTGLETLIAVNSKHPEIPVVMITKSEDEGIMEKAIGRKIADYLIKPVNPHQILMAIKKILEKKEIITETNIENYREEFGRLSEKINRCETAEDWAEVYKTLVLWDKEFTLSHHPMQEILQMQHADANSVFVRFVKKNYLNWFAEQQNAPVMSHNLMDQSVLPVIDRGEKLFFILIDNFRFDHWFAIKELVSEYFTYDEQVYFSMLPTTTQYARNALFAGMTPFEISKQMPEHWVDESDEKGKNLSEEFLLQSYLNRRRSNSSLSYHKINSNAEGERIVANFVQLEQYDLNVLVFNFIDVLSHMRSESKMIRELAPNESAYRSLAYSWFQHSPLPELLKKISENGYQAILTTDHGTIRVKNPQKIIAEKNTNSNLRYKTGRNLTYDSKKVFEIVQPELAGLPAPHISSRYIFAQKDDFFVYSNNLNHYVSQYENTFQHGGISMEEMIVPLITLYAK